MFRRGVFTFLGVLLIAGTTGAVDPADKCEADKLKAVGKYSSCRLKAESKSLKNGLPPDFTKCDQSYDARWARIEATAEAKKAESHPSFGAAADIKRTASGNLIKGVVRDCVDIIQGIVSGTPIPPACAFPATGQMTCWDSSGAVIACAGTGHDGDIQAGAPLAYVDNGDGTITDLNTGLMWEKKSRDGSIHDVFNMYTWDEAFAVHVAGLNAASFAGHTDWRVPNLKELHIIADYETFSPLVDPVFNTGCVSGCTVTTCSCTWSTFYWSSSSHAAFPDRAWVVNFGSGSVSNGFKSGSFRVRAVRGGL
jgi:hypothetical protein